VFVEEVANLALEVIMRSRREEEVGNEIIGDADQDEWSANAAGGHKSPSKELETPC